MRVSNICIYIYIYIYIFLWGVGGAFSVGARGLVGVGISRSWAVVGVSQIAVGSQGSASRMRWQRTLKPQPYTLNLKL